MIFTPDGRIIQLTKLSSCLLIPESFSDSKFLKGKCDSQGNMEKTSKDVSPLASPNKMKVLLYLLIFNSHKLTKRLKKMQKKDNIKEIRSL